MVKPGYTTSEFWGMIATQVIAVVTVFHPSLTAEKLTPIAQAVAVLAAAIAGAVYSRSRSYVKGETARATADVTTPAPVASTVPPAEVARLQGELSDLQAQLAKLSTP